MDIKQISFVGGDMRIIHLIELFSKENYQIKIFGFDKYDFKLNNVTKCTTLVEAITDAQIVIGPLPFSSNGATINAPFNSSPILISDLVELLNSNQVLIAGRLDTELNTMFAENNIKAIDILSREEFAVLNAISTAEGAIQIAMENSQCTLHNTPVLVLGFGRIGKILCKMLDGLGADVYCEARKFSDIAWIKAYGYKPIHLNDIDKHLEKFNIFINTIPYVVFDKERIDRMNKNSLFIDLASKPGGIDIEAGKEKDINIILALSLPGKVAPLTAATHIKETVGNIFEEI